MSENKDIKNVNKIEDSILAKIAGGATEEEIEAAFEEVKEGAKNAGEAVVNVFNSLEAINEAIKTNICPICKQQIIPGAAKCKVADFLKHGKAFH